jgi:hypothetical protein
MFSLRIFLPATSNALTRRTSGTSRSQSIERQLDEDAKKAEAHGGFDPKGIREEDQKVVRNKGNTRNYIKVQVESSESIAMKTDTKVTGPKPKRRSEMLAD